MRPKTCLDDRVQTVCIYCAMLMTFYAPTTTQTVCCNTNISLSHLSWGMANNKLYLGAKLCKTRLHNGVQVLAMSPMRNTNEGGNYNGRYKMPKRAGNPFALRYDPEMDVSPKLSSDIASYFHSIIGIFRWMVELGKIDIITNVL